MSTDQTMKKEICRVGDTSTEQRKSVAPKRHAIKPDVKGKKALKTAYSEREEGELVTESDDTDDAVEASEINSDQALQPSVVEITSPCVEEDIINLSVSQEDINLIGAEVNDYTFGDYEEGEVIGNGIKFKREIKTKTFLQKSFENKKKWTNGIKQCAKNGNANNTVEQVALNSNKKNDSQQHEERKRIGVSLQCDKRGNLAFAEDSAEDGEIQSPHPEHSNQTCVMAPYQAKPLMETKKPAAERKCFATENAESGKINTVDQACIGSPRTADNEPKCAPNSEHKIHSIKGPDVSNTAFPISQQPKNNEALVKNEKNLNVEGVSVAGLTPFVDKQTDEIKTSQQFSNKAINFHKTASKAKQNDANMASAASFLHCMENVVKNFDGLRKNIVGNKINDFLLEVVEAKKQKIMPRNEVEKFRAISITNSIQLTKTSSPQDLRKSAEKSAMEDTSKENHQQKPESIVWSTTAVTRDISKRSTTSSSISKILQKVLEIPCSSNCKISGAPIAAKTPNVDAIEEALPVFGPCWLFPSPKYTVSIHAKRLDQSPSPRLYRKERKLKIFDAKEKACVKRPKPYDKPELNLISKADGIHLVGCAHLQPYCPYTTKTRIPLNVITLYDERGRLRCNGADICDCGNENCIGCWYNCFECGSSRCGLSCRCNRQVYPDFWIIKHTKRTTQQH